MAKPVDAQFQSVLIASGLDDLQKQNPIVEGQFKPQRAYVGEGFRVTHVAFDAGIELPSHAAPVPILVQIAEGVVDFVVGEDQVHRMNQGAILHLPADVPHSVHSIEKARVIVTFLGDAA